MSEADEGVKIDYRPRMDHEDGPYSVEPLYVNFAEVTSNQFEVRLALGRLPMRVEPGDVNVPKMAELIFPPLVAEQVAKLIMSNLEMIRRVQAAQG
jgi:hypothetical protein